MAASHLTKETMQRQVQRHRFPMDVKVHAIYFHFFCPNQHAREKAPAQTASKTEEWEGKSQSNAIVDKEVAMVGEEDMIAQLSRRHEWTQTQFYVIAKATRNPPHCAATEIAEEGTAPTLITAVLEGTRPEARFARTHWACNSQY